MVGPALAARGGRLAARVRRYGLTLWADFGEPIFSIYHCLWGWGDDGKGEGWKYTPAYVLGCTGSGGDVPVHETLVFEARRGAALYVEYFVLFFA